MKILSIDFNIIMSSCIKLYADKININENPRLVWDYLNDVYEMDKHVYLDAKILSSLIALIKKNKSAKFAPITTPRAIVEEVLKENEKVDITNIDFFHNLITVEEEIKEWDEDNYNDLNWLGYLIYKDKIENCTWVKAVNSFPCENNIVNDVKIYNTFEIDKLEDDYDIIYFTLSPHYVPYKFEYIFRLFCDFFSDNIEIEDIKENKHD